MRGRKQVAQVDGMVLGPLPCVRCRRLVSWWRHDSMWRLRNHGNRTPHRVCRAPLENAA